MTEKEFRNVLSLIEFTNKEKYNSVFSKISEVLSFDSTYLKTIEINKVGLYSKQLLVSESNVLELSIKCDLLKEINETLRNKVIINAIENSLILDLDVKNIVLMNNTINFKLDDLDIKLLVVDDTTLEIEKQKNKLCEIINTKYTYFKNTYKLLKHYLYELKIDIINDEALFILLAYSLEKYFTNNKYESYIFGFIRAIDDFINLKQIELEDDYGILHLQINDNLKTYQILNPFSKNSNLSSNINETNIGEVRKFKKRLQKLFELELNEVGSSILKLNINPKELENGMISWNYEVSGRNLKNSGGEFENTELEHLNATLKGYFRGLKAICESQINNKNITVISKYKDLLKCGGDSSYSEINSRRKTITKYIEENKLLVTYQN